MNAVKKLSRLQKQILLLALENKLREGRAFPEEEDGGADVYYAEILATVYGFPPTGPLRQGYDPAGRRLAGGWKFSPGEIGQARYNAAQAAVSRAMLRLHSRGLAVCVWGAISHWSGCSLTSAGLEAAKTVKSIVKSELT
jgi:hypothetical protein